MERAIERILGEAKMERWRGAGHALSLACCVAALAGCIPVVHVSGESSGKAKHNLEESWLFKSSDILYPAGTHGVAEYPHLNKESLGYLETGLKGMLALVVDLHARNAVTAGKYFNADLPKSVKASVLVDNLDQPIAKSFVDEQGNLEIRVDARVLQATFRGSLVAGLRASDEFNFSSKKSGGETDDELLADFVKYKEGVSKAKAGNLFGDLAHSGGDDLDKGRWFQMMDMESKGNEIQSRYTGTLMFLMAHEVGHYVLKHHQEECDASKCERFAEKELEADRYGGFLLGAFLAPFSSQFEVFGQGIGIFQGLESFFPISHLTGFEVFFDDAYERIGFVNAKASLCSCAYPEPKLRQAAALAGKERANQEFVELYAKDPAAAQRTTPMVMKPAKRHRSQ